MKKPSFRIILSLILLGSFFLSPIRAGAVELPDEIIVTDTESLKVVPGGEYFYSVRDMLPGETYTKSFQVSDTDTHSYDLYFETEPIEFSGDMNLLELIDLEIHYAGELIYKGSLNGNGIRGDGTPLNTNEETIYLGKLHPGAQKLIATQVYLDGERIGNDWQGAYCKMRWIFIAKREEDGGSSDSGTTVPKSPSSPITGDTIRVLQYITGFLVSALAILPVGFILWKRLREKQRRPVKSGE